MIFVLKGKFLRFSYSYLIASIGESLAAFFAGKTPKKIPMAEETRIAKNTEIGVICAGKKNLTTKQITRQEMAIPKIPPITERITDSAKN